MFVTNLDWLYGALVGSLLTFFLTLLIWLLGNRRSQLTYHVTYDRIGISAFDNIHGDVLVTVGGEKVQNLFMSNIWVENRSIRDLEDLEIKVFCGQDMVLMTEQTLIQGTVENLKYSPEFEKIFNKMVNATTKINDLNVVGKTQEIAKIRLNQQKNWQTYTTSRGYFVPMLGRGQTIKLTYMTEVKSGAYPAIYIACQKAGVRVKYKEPYQPVWHIWGVPLAEAGIVGVIIVSIIGIMVISLISIHWIVGIVCLVIGLFGNVVGASVVKFYRWFRNLAIG